MPILLLGVNVHQRGHARIDFRNLEQHPMQLNSDLFANTMQPASRAALAAVEVLASRGGAEARGAVFIRREVVDFILNLAGSV